ncbi:nucleotidyl transferase AbiEii/AbiGii toxin family protein [Engelhardtia mirabilis]|uniref:Uncharacterized protein n=1 Tax=Engelhardtia mirabilis TaxID=2528011 RepID=A0A518BS49_9BACT|nr:hypothetical protein Pla133_49120 [Planctomycetes bacterium Pla133]QDV04116.1 hypothetical protein Pla86_49100 [Planctomycetes bacterium Pla86]
MSRSRLSPLQLRVLRALADAEPLQPGATFHRCRVAHGDDSVVVDLVADPVATVEVPVVGAIDGVPVRVDTPHEILVNNLCALLSRSEVRDLVDARVLLASGGDLDRAVRDAPTKDGGFSALVLADVLRGFPLQAAELDPSLLEGHAAFRDDLVTRLLRGSVPG